MTLREIAGYIDHTILKPEASKEEIKKLCNEAKEFAFASVCVNGSYVKLCKEYLKGTEVKVCTVVGFPLGAMATEAKVFETEQALKDGAEEIDMVINIGRLKDHEDDYVLEEIRCITSAAKRYNAVTKVIIETALLNEEEKIRACKLCLKAEAEFVKTSTGFSKTGATYEDVKLMKNVVGNKTKLKAAGGIRTLDDALKMIECGADRIGASASVSIINELKNTLNKETA